MLNKISNQFIPTCLLVDDLEENLIALKELLKEEKVKVVTAKSGIEALELMLEHDFALALVDVQMPEMDGFELAEIMRSTDRTRSVPIIFVTAAGSDSRRVFQGYEAGAVDFMHKPLSQHIVVSKVRIFLELYTQKILLEQKLEKIKITEANLNRALQSRDEFLSICSHELKTPLTTLKMQIQITERMRKKLGDEVAFSPDNMNKFLNQADRSVERIIHLVNDMLDISRVNTGRLSLHMKEINLGKLVKDCVERLQHLLELSNCPVDIKDEGDIVIKADGFRIEQVVTNILTNAAKYAPEAKIDISIRKMDNLASLTIRDHGKGIPKKDQDRIFNRFERAVESNFISGLGLGLYISKEIIDMHNGTITLSSEPGEGASFNVRLPLN